MIRKKYVVPENECSILCPVGLMVHVFVLFLFCFYQNAFLCFFWKEKYAKFEDNDDGGQKGKMFDLNRFSRVGNRDTPKQGPLSQLCLQQCGRLWCCCVALKSKPLSADPSAD